MSILRKLARSIDPPAPVSDWDAPDPELDSERGRLFARRAQRLARDATALGYLAERVPGLEARVRELESGAAHQAMRREVAAAREREGRAHSDVSAAAGELAKLRRAVRRLEGERDELVTDRARLIRDLEYARGILQSTGMITP